MISSVLRIFLLSLIGVQAAVWDPYGPPKPPPPFHHAAELRHPGLRRPKPGILIPHDDAPYRINSHGPAAYPVHGPPLPPPPYHPPGLEKFSLKSVRKLTALIKAICKLCGKNVHHLAYASFYDKGDAYGDYNDKEEEEYDDHYDDDDEDFEHFSFLRSLLETNETESSGSSGGNTEHTEQDSSSSSSGQEDYSWPTVTRAKRSTGPYSPPPPHNYFNNFYYHPYSYHQLPGYVNYLQEGGGYYGRPNPHYLYSKLAFIEEKLREKRRQRRNKKNKKAKKEENVANVLGDILGDYDKGAGKDLHAER